MAGGKRDTYPPRRDKMTEHIFLAGRFTTIVNRPAIFMSGDILAKHRAPRYAYIIQTNGGKIHEISFENTIRPHHRGARCRDLVLCLPSQPVLCGVRHRRRNTRFLRRGYPIRRFCEKWNYHVGACVPRQPLRSAHAGGVAAGAAPTAAVRGAG